MNILYIIPINNKVFHVILLYLDISDVGVQLTWTLSSLSGDMIGI